MTLEQSINLTFALGAILTCMGLWVMTEVYARTIRRSLAFSKARILGIWGGQQVIHQRAMRKAGMEPSVMDLRQCAERGGDYRGFPRMVPSLLAIGRPILGAGHTLRVSGEESGKPRERMFARPTGGEFIEVQNEAEALAVIAAGVKATGKPVLHVLNGAGQAKAFMGEPRTGAHSAPQGMGGETPTLGGDGAA